MLLDPIVSGVGGCLDPIHTQGHFSAEDSSRGELTTHCKRHGIKGHSTFGVVSLEDVAVARMSEEGASLIGPLKLSNIGCGGSTPGVVSNAGGEAKVKCATLDVCRDAGSKDRLLLVDALTFRLARADHREIASAGLDGDVNFITVEKAGYSFVNNQELATDQDGQKAMGDRVNDIFAHGWVAECEIHGTAHFIAIAFDLSKGDDCLEIASPCRTGAKDLNILPLEVLIRSARCDADGARSDTADEPDEPGEMVLLCIVGIDEMFAVVLNETHDLKNFSQSKFCEAEHWRGVTYLIRAVAGDPIHDRLAA